MSEKHKESSINWGGLTKGLLAGGAIIAGIAIVCPGCLSGIADALSKIGAPVAGKAAPSLVENGVDYIKSGVGSMLGTVIAKVAGVALAVTGIKYLLSDKPNNAAEHATQYHEAQESFALREDMRKMQAVMASRMQAAGHEPAAGAPAR